MEEGAVRTTMYWVAKQESLRPAVIFHFPDDTSLCPVLWFKAYEKATASLSEKRKQEAY